MEQITIVIEVLLSLLPLAGVRRQEFGRGRSWSVRSYNPRDRICFEWQTKIENILTRTENFLDEIWI